MSQYNYISPILGSSNIFAALSDDGEDSSSFSSNKTKENKEEKKDYKQPLRQKPSYSPSSSSLTSYAPRRTQLQAKIAQKTQSEIRLVQQPQFVDIAALIENTLTKQRNQVKKIDLDSLANVWKNYESRFEKANYIHTFQVLFFCKSNIDAYQPMILDAYQPMIHGMVEGVVMCLNAFANGNRAKNIYPEVTRTIANINALSCKQKQLTRFFENRSRHYLKNFSDSAIINIISSYKILQLYKTEAGQNFLKDLSTEQTRRIQSISQNVELLVQQLGQASISKQNAKQIASVVSLVVDDKGALQKATPSELANMAAIAENTGKGDELTKIYNHVMTGGDKNSLLFLADTWTKDKDFTQAVTKIFKAFVFQNIAEKNFYEQLLKIADDDFINDLSKADAIDFCLALVVSEQSSSDMIGNLLATLDEACIKGWTPSHEQLEKLSWIKMALAYEADNAFQWQEKGLALHILQHVEGLKKTRAQQAPITEKVAREKNVKTQFDLYEHVQKKYRKENVLWEEYVDGLQVDILVKNQRNDKKDIVIELLGPHHYYDKNKCQELNTQSACRLRLLQAMPNIHVVPVSTLEWEKINNTQESRSTFLNSLII